MTNHFSGGHKMDQDFYLNFPSYNLPKRFSSALSEQEYPLEFHKSLPTYNPTPLHSLPGLARKYGVARLYIKDESYRLGLNAFKGLGASYAIHKILEKRPDTSTFCTATDGNHGRAVAWSARLLGKNSVVFVSRNTSRERIESIEKEGAVVIDSGMNYDATCQIAQESAAKNDWVLLQDTAWEGYEEIPGYIMAGYLTLFQEIGNQIDSLEEIDLVMLQAGVGSWAAAGVWYFINNLKNRPKLVIVEPYESDGILASFKAKKREAPKGNFETIMAGLNCGIPSLIAWEIIKNGADAAIRIQDDYAIQAMRELYHPTNDDPRIISGESGVGGLAGFLCLVSEPKAQSLRKHLHITENTNVLCISTEGATDEENFRRIVNQEHV